MTTPDPAPRRIEVVGAVIVSDGLILCAQRGPGSLEGMWEFPGGKVEPGESPEVALVREIREELDCEVHVGEFVTTTVEPVGSVEVALCTYWRELVSGEPVATEHKELRWVAPVDMRSLGWAPADVPAVDLVVAQFR